ncbi:cilia- and flagella-associated protein 53 isoform X1 [Alligator sinensis]|uniref:Cilia- and flagella-associated protein 53 n=1 Tax=Alligator sinensis TaxID=38654 RepID=A0A1U7SMH9_ALLSI|nr:cilia- and flagella-associated protein 53 isoform X1 [Alligator sinensis]
MEQLWSRRPREVSGPTPHSVALRAKGPKSNKAESFLLACRRKEEERLKYLEFAKLHSKGREISQWEEHNECKRLHSTVRKKVAETMQEYLAGTEDRRERLRELLEAEENSYFSELESLEETVLERQAKMRERLKLLREKREEERQKLVAEKREQQFRPTMHVWPIPGSYSSSLDALVKASAGVPTPPLQASQREQCEEFRLHWSQRHQKEVCADRLAQLALKEELKNQEKKEEQMFADLWEEDRLAKEKREAVDIQKQAEQNQERLNVLNAQVSVLNAQKEAAKRLKEEEARLLEEEKQLLKLENERLQLEKLQKQKECRDMLVSSIREKMKRLNREKQEELALDMKILEQVLQESQEDTEGKKKKKQELFKEQQIYREHLAAQLEEEKRREKEMDKLLEEEMERTWAKKAEQMRLEKEARKRLMKDVLDTRRLQIEEKLERNAKQQEKLAQDKLLLAEAIKELNHIDGEKYSRKIQEAKEYREQLQAQIAYQQQAHHAEEEEKQREYESGLAAEQEYQEKIKHILSRSHLKLTEIHPLRRKLMTDLQV